MLIHAHPLQMVPKEIKMEIIRKRRITGTTTLSQYITNQNAYVKDGSPNYHIKQAYNQSKHIAYVKDGSSELPHLSSV